jgi:hypothetical protein
MHLSGLDLLFWAAGLIGHVVLLFILLWRKRAAKYPIFTALIATSVIRTVVLAVILSFGSKRQYFLSFWSLALVDTALQFSVVYEIAAHTFRPLGRWARDVRSSLVGLIGLSLLIAVGLTCLASPPTRIWMQTVVIKGNFFSEVCMSEFFVGILAVSVTAGLPWKTHAAKISTGLAVYSMIDVLIESGHNYFGIVQDYRVYHFLSHFRIAAYVGCLCYWILSLWPEEPASRPLSDELRVQLPELQRRVQEDLRSLRSRRHP